MSESDPVVPATANWFVYLVSCADGSLYCGITTDVHRRVAQHNGLLPGGARCTRARRPVELVTCTACANRSEALRLEALIKKTPRQAKVDALCAAGTGVGNVKAPCGNTGL